MKHAHQTTKPRPDLAKYPMPTAETAWAIAQEFLAARRRPVETAEEIAASSAHRGNAVTDLLTPEQYKRYAAESDDLLRRYQAAQKAADTCTCPRCEVRRLISRLES